MTRFTALLLQRVFPTTISLVNRRVIATGITSSIFAQPLYRLLPLAYNVITRGMIPFTFSPLSHLIPAMIKLSLPHLINLLVTAVVYRVLANLLKAMVLWPLRVLAGDLLAMATPLANKEWFIDINRHIFDILKSVLKEATISLDSIFAFTVGHSGFMAIIASAAALAYGVYKYELITSWFHIPLFGWVWDVVDMRNLLTIAAGYIKWIVINPLTASIYRATSETLRFIFGPYLITSFIFFIELGILGVKTVWHMWLPVYTLITSGLEFAYFPILRGYVWFLKHAYSFARWLVTWRGN